MDDPEAYAKVNKFVKLDAEDVLREYSNIIKWNQSDRVIDVGSGEGGVTDVLRKFLPPTAEVIGVDINENMVKYANENFGDEKTKFMLLDITNKLPSALVGDFNHVFSNYLIHWINEEDHECMFKNMYDMLLPGGDLLLTCMIDTVWFDILYELARVPKFQQYSNATGLMVSHKDSTPTEKLENVRNLMSKVGFTDVKVEYKERSFDFGPLSVCKRSLLGVSTYNFPPGVEDEYCEAIAQKVREKLLTPEDDDETHIVVDHKLLVAYGKK